VFAWVVVTTWTAFLVVQAVEILQEGPGHWLTQERTDDEVAGIVIVGLLAIATLTAPIVAGLIWVARRVEERRWEAAARGGRRDRARP
jgi:hypothetical protein